MWNSRTVTPFEEGGSGRKGKKIVRNASDKKKRFPTSNEKLGKEKR